MNDLALPEKLQKRLDAIRAAGGMEPWSRAPKKNQRLLERGLILKGNGGEGQSFAVLPELVPDEDPS